MADERARYFRKLRRLRRSARRWSVLAASYVAEDGRAATEHPAVHRLTEASELLRGVAAGLAELREFGDPARAAHYST